MLDLIMKSLAGDKVFIIDEAHIFFGKSAELDNAVIGLFRESRNSNTSIIISTQSEKDIPKTILNILADKITK